MSLSAYESDFLVARAPSTAQLLAMKLAAWRDAIDRDDARLLLSKMTGSMQAVWGAVEPFVPAGPHREPLFLDPGLEGMPRTLARAKADAPESLRKRNLYALPDFLDVR